MDSTLNKEYDFVIIGSGFGGSVSALRLTEKGYRVLVIEKGKWFKPYDFPKTNWNIKKWLWLPFLKCKGLFKITFFRHVAVLSGVGVGGGSLVYANTLPVPKKAFYNTGSWAKLKDWETELQPFYLTALEMLGATKVPTLQPADKIIKKLSEEVGKAECFEIPKVAVYFGKTGETVDDPYFNGEGPSRTGCIECGACMLGCPNNAKNTLDKNYLWLAQKKGLQIIANSEVYDVQPIDATGESGYHVLYKDSASVFPSKQKIKTKSIIFSGGVLGTVNLLLNLKKKSLPNLSEKIGYGIRTNSESLIGVTTFDKDKKFSEGVAIGSLFHTDENSHLEAVRYPDGSGVWRLLMAPMVSGKNFLTRIFNAFKDVIKHPIATIKLSFIDDWSKRTIILLFMQTIDSTIRFKKSFFGMKSSLDVGKAPSSDIPEAQSLAKKVAQLIQGKAAVLSTELIFGIPTTAHILGGACMGNSAEDGVIDADNKVFGYQNMYICDGSMISANPGVNPSLSITAISERAMSKIKPK